MRTSLLLDLAALNKIELLPTDGWWDLSAKKEEEVSPEEHILLDAIASRCSQVDEHFDELRATFDENIDLSGPVNTKLKLMGLLGENRDPVSGRLEPAGGALPGRSSQALQPSDRDRLAALGRTAPHAQAAHSFKATTSPNGRHHRRRPGCDRGARGAAA